jgi:hypothetical protein
MIGQQQRVLAGKLTHQVKLNLEGIRLAPQLGIGVDGCGRG